MWVFYVIAVLSFLGVLALVVTMGVLRYGREVDQSMRSYGTRVVRCPESGKPAAVETSSEGDGPIRLTECSQWPERQDCDHACVGQLEAAPEGCLVRSTLTNWYRGKSCAICEKTFEEVNWFDFKPALMSAEREVFEWHELPVEVLPSVLPRAVPVCRACFDSRNRPATDSQRRSEES